MRGPVERNARIGIVGGGAWGLSAALALSEDGYTDIRLWEATGLGSGATGRAAGLVSTHLRLEPDIRHVLETRRRLAELRAWGEAEGEPSAAHCFHAVGGLTVMPHADGDKLDRLAVRIRHCGGTVERWTSRDLERAPWPLQSTNHLTGLFTPEDGCVEAGDLVALLSARLRHLGVRLETDRAARLRLREGRVDGVEVAGRAEPCDAVLLAAGAWSKRLAADVGLALPLKAYRTQLAQLEFPHRPDLPILHDTESRVYARPDGPTRVLAGDGTEFVERAPDAFNQGVDATFVEKIAKAASRRWRGGAAAGFRTGWAGLCVATPDRNPLIGAVPGAKGLFLMAGDNGFGVMRCLSLGRVAAARMAGRMVPGAEAYDPRRVSTGLDFEIREGFEL